MSELSLYWHDYETFGLDPQRDRPAQFAGLRTDVDFNIIDDPLVIYCQLASDSLPHPDACVITGITPQLATERGLCEAKFIRLIHEQMSQPNTCNLGYNNLRFDDEVTRNCLYRNFYDPYTREWQQGNSRWDLIDVVRATKALRPDGINWPETDDGKPTIRLDQLTIANGIAHTTAHDALSDVLATIALAKLVKEAQPRLYTFFWQHRHKAAVLELLSLGSFKPVVHISGKYLALKNSLAIVLPICKHPTNSNGIIVYDLSIDPEPMISLPVEEIKLRIFTANENLPEGVARIPLKTVHINKCPVLAPIKVIRPEDESRLQLDLKLCQSHIEKIRNTTNLAAKIARVFGDLPVNEHIDPDLAIYRGGFFADSDKAKMAKVRNLPPAKLAKTAFNFTDSRLSEMLFRYRARNFPETLTNEEQQLWQTFCVERLTGQDSVQSLSLADYFDRLNELKTQPELNHNMLSALETYGLDRMRDLEISGL